MVEDRVAWFLTTALYALHIRGAPHESREALQWKGLGMLLNLRIQAVQIRVLIRTILFGLRKLPNTWEHITD